MEEMVLQIWRVGVNILNKPSQTDDKGRAKSMGLKTLHCKKQHVTKCYTEPDLDGFFGTYEGGSGGRLEKIA
jgi:hypothetical protein